MKVLFFPYYPNNPYQPNLAKSLRAHGYEVKGVKDISLLTLIRAMKGINIYHLHWTHPYIVSDKLWKAVVKAAIFFLILIILKLRGRILIWTVHNLGEHEKKQQNFELFAHRILARLCGGIIVHSRYARQKVIEQYCLKKHAAKVQIIPHGHYIGNYPDDMTRERARHMLNLPIGYTVFLFFGQIRDYKGVPELIKAFFHVLTGKEVLIIAGQPADQKTNDNLKTLIGTNTSILYSPEFVPDEKIQLYMKAADVVVFPFCDIFTSGSLHLAISFEKAIIIPELDSLGWIIEIGGAITFRHEEIDGLETALKSALTTDLHELGRRNLKAAKELSWESIASKTVNMYLKSNNTKLTDNKTFD